MVINFISSFNCFWCRKGDLGAAVKSFKEGMRNPKKNVSKKKAKK